MGSKGRTRIRKLKNRGGERLKQWRLMNKLNLFRCEKKIKTVDEDMKWKNNESGIPPLMGMAATNWVTYPYSQASMCKGSLGKDVGEHSSQAGTSTATSTAVEDNMEDSSAASDVQLVQPTPQESHQPYSVAAQVWPSVSQSSPKSGEGRVHTPTDLESCHDMSYTQSNVDEMEQSDNNTDRPDLIDRPAGVMEDTLDLFGRYVSSILRQLPVTKSYTLQQKFINEAISAKLQYEKEHPSPPPCQTELQPVGIHSSDVARKSTSMKTRKRKSKEKAAESSTDVPSITPIDIKQEPVEDVEHFDTGLGEDNSKTTDSRVTEDCEEINIEEGQELSKIKSEIASDFEVVYCDGSYDDQTTRDRLEAPPQRSTGDCSPSPHSEKQLFTCALCSMAFVRSLDLKIHNRNKHPGINPSLKSKLPSKQQPGSKKPCLETTRTTTMHNPVQPPAIIAAGPSATTANSTASTCYRLLIRDNVSTFVPSVLPVQQFVPCVVTVPSIRTTSDSIDNSSVTLDPSTTELQNQDVKMDKL